MARAPAPHHLRGVRSGKLRETSYQIGRSRPPRYSCRTELIPFYSVCRIMVGLIRLLRCVGARTIRSRALLDKMNSSPKIPDARRPNLVVLRSPREFHRRAVAQHLGCPLGKFVA